MRTERKASGETTPRLPVDLDHRPGITRRSFLTGAIALGLPAWAELPTRSDGAVDFSAQRAQGKLGVALIGLGGFSTNSIAPELAFSKNVYFAGVVTKDTKGKGRKFAAHSRIRYFGVGDQGLPGSTRGGAGRWRRSW